MNTKTAKIVKSIKAEFPKFRGVCVIELLVVLLFFGGSKTFAITGVFDITTYGADGTDTGDDTDAIQDAIDDAVAHEGGTVYFPAGTYFVSSSLNYYIGYPSGIRLVGAGLMATNIVYTASTGACFTNEQPIGGGYKYQYSLYIADMSLSTVAPGESFSLPRNNSATGIHVEMLQKHWEIDRVSVAGFNLGLFIGLHSEAGRVERSNFCYNNYGAFAQGMFADMVILDSCWIYANYYNNLRVSAPRIRVLNCFFAEYSSHASACTDIQLGYSAIRTEDIGKAADAVAGAGSGPQRCIISGNGFEGGDANTEEASILFQDFDTYAGRLGDITIENNNLAVYYRPAAIRFVKSYDNIIIRNNQLSSTEGSPLIKVDTGNTLGNSIINNPNVIHEFGSLADYWKFGFVPKSEFESWTTVAEDICAGGVWSFYSPNQTYSVDNTNKVITVNYSTEYSYIRLRRTNCPAGLVKFKMDLAAAPTSDALRIHVIVKQGAATYWSRTNIPVSYGRKSVVFGFDNPTEQTIDVYIHVNTTLSGTYCIYNPEAKID